MSGETPNRVISALKLSCGLKIGTPVTYRGRDWEIGGGPCGDNQPPEVRDLVFLVRDRTPSGGYTSMCVHASDLRPMDLLDVLADESPDSEPVSEGGQDPCPPRGQGSWLSGPGKQGARHLARPMYDPAP